MPISPTHPTTQSFAAAIALAEGYNVAGTVPNRTNNPGDLKNGNIGSGTLPNGVTSIYPTPEAGMTALQYQAAHILNGDSKSYSYDPNDTTINDAAKIYAPSNAVNWANNVSGALGVPPDTTLGAIANGAVPVQPASAILPANKLAMTGTQPGQPQTADSATSQKQVQSTDALLSPAVAVPVAGQDITDAAYAGLATFLQVSPDASMKMTPWFNDNNLITGNPRIRKSVQPVTFQVFLSQKGTGQPLVDSMGKPVTLQLNVSMNQISILSKHASNRQPTRTGMHITFWGMAPDTITGQATTGVFQNQYGLTDYFSTAKITDDIATKVGAAFSNNPDTEQLIAQNPEAYRVAAQDAFVEFLKLFQMNGLVWYNTPTDQNATYLQGQQQSTPAAWSPQTGSSTFQRNSRNNDVRSKGYVVMNYRNSKYLGYFKSLSWRMDAEKPFQWQFSFVFQVERTLTAYFYPLGIAVAAPLNSRPAPTLGLAALPPPTGQ
jgi:hypothetical protein